MRNCRRTHHPQPSLRPLLPPFRAGRVVRLPSLRRLTWPAESCQDCVGCPSCRDTAFHFQHAIPLGAYEGALREALLKGETAGLRTPCDRFGAFVFPAAAAGTGGVSPRSDYSYPDVLVATSPPASEFPPGDCPHVGGIAACSRGGQSADSCAKHIATEGFIARGSGSQRSRGISASRPPPPALAGLACPVGR